MGLIVRPTKLGGGSDVVAGNDVLASEWNGDMNTIYTLVNGNLENINIKAGAGIEGSKLADAPNGVSAAKLNTDAVETAKIKDDQVTLAKLKNTLRLGTDRLGHTIHEVTTVTNIGGSVVDFTAFAEADNSGTNWAGRVVVYTKIGAGPPENFTFKSTTANPTSTFAKADYDLIGLYIKNRSYSNPNATIILVYVFQKRASV